LSAGSIELEIGMGALRTILHPTDFSESANKAFEWACSLAKENKAQLIVLHIMLPSSAPLVDATSPDPMRVAESQPDLKGAFPWPKPLQPGVVVEHRVAEGDAATVILRMASALECDVIIMGTHGRTGLKRLLTGSVAEEVMRKATCPVLVVKEQVEDHADGKTQPPAGMGEVVDVEPPGPTSFRTNSTRVLAQGDDIQVLRLEIPAGEDLQRPSVPGETMFYSIEGRIAVTFAGKTEHLSAGQFICLPGHRPCLLKSLDNAIVLMTATKTAGSESRVATNI
jgi:nucleotide-binding universal stress UspA family protein/quercetin dioxygenase-like cupin family protein